MGSRPSEIDLYYLLMKLRHGGSLVSAAHCTPDEVAIARGDGRLFMDKDENGYVYLPKNRSIKP